MSNNSSTGGGPGETQSFVTATLSDHLFGVPVLSVHDILSPHALTDIPLASAEVAGALNLRGRIVTAIDLRVRLGMPPADRGKSMGIVVEHLGEPYSLLIDEVGEVLSVPSEAFEHNPPTLDPRWRDVACGVFRLDQRLMVVLDVERLLDFGEARAA